MASVSWAMASASSSWMSRRPPRPFFRSGSARWAISPLRSHRVCAWAMSSSKRERIPVRHSRRTPPISRLLKSWSPTMCLASSMPSAAMRSSAATRNACGTVRTLWSSLMCASHSGYQS
jgi:hypothetical protein